MQAIKGLSKQWGQDIEVNGKQVEVRVTVNVYYDDHFDLDWDFESDEDRKQVESQIERGILNPVVIQVDSHIEGHLFGFDSLSGCLIQLTDAQVDEIVQGHGMVENSLDDAKKALQDFLKTVA